MWLSIWTIKSAAGGAQAAWNRNQVLSREDTSDFIGESFYLSVVINLAWLTVEFLQIPLRFSVAVDNALLALKFRQDECWCQRLT